MFNNQHTNNIVAKLLATENITVHRQNVRTAFFDIEKRLLVLPIWKNMENVVEQMLICHEVGHALFSTFDDYTTAIKKLDFTGAASYVNILEDIRIEKFMHKKFLGIGKTFSLGYKILFDKDFFGIKNTYLQSLTLIDRINIHFKVGIYVSVPFSTDERVFIERASATETLDQICVLAKDIYDFDLINHNIPMTFINNDLFEDEDGDVFSSDKKKFIDDSDNDSDNDSEYDSTVNNDSKDLDTNSDTDSDTDSDSDSDTDSDNDSNNEGESNSNTPNADENILNRNKELPNPITDSNFKNNIDQTISSNTHYMYWEFEDFPYNPVVSYKNIIKKIEKSYKRDFSTPFHLAYIEKFKNESLVNVNYLVKEFEMRKAAQNYKRNNVAKTGSLNEKKLYAYKIADNLFKQITITHDGKNHGMVFLLDWSGSMASNINKTMEQLINLVMFCNRAQIKYTVLAFTTNQSINPNKLYNLHDSNINYITVDKNLMLMELFTHEMSSNDFNKMISITLHPYFNNVYEMNATPLLDALIYVNKFLDSFLKKNRVEKFTFVTFTDGESNNFDKILPSKYYADDGVKYYKHFYISPVTKIEYELSSTSVVQNTEVFYKMFKDTYDCNIIGFYLLRDTRISSFAFGIAYNDSKHSTLKKELRYTIAEDAKTRCMANTFVKLDNTAKDAMYLLTPMSMLMSSGELTINKDATARQISKSFMKYLNTRKISRVLLNNILTYIT